MPSHNRKNTDERLNVLVMLNAAPCWHPQGSNDIHGTSAPPESNWNLHPSTRLFPPWLVFSFQGSIDWFCKHVRVGWYFGDLPKPLHWSSFSMAQKWTVESAPAIFQSWNSFINSATAFLPNFKYLSRDVVRFLYFVPFYFGDDSQYLIFHHIRSHMCSPSSRSESLFTLMKIIHYLYSFFRFLTSFGSTSQSRIFCCLLHFFVLLMLSTYFYAIPLDIYITPSTTFRLPSLLLSSAYCLVGHVLV